VSLWLVAMGIFVAMIIFLAVIPSWWLYFADATLKWTDNFTLSLGIRKIVLAKQVIRDLIVVIWYGVALLASGVLIRVYNRRNTKVLAADESKREATGGYR
jgi:cytochrome c biogenesis factor